MWYDLSVNYNKEQKVGDDLKIYGDRYNRYDEVDNIVEIIQNCLTLKKPTAFSLEANWGKGKTWILEKIEAKLKGADLSKKVPIENAADELVKEIEEL